MYRKVLRVVILEYVESGVTLKQNDAVVMGIIFKKITYKIHFGAFTSVLYKHTLLKFFTMEIVKHESKIICLPNSF